MGPMQQGSYPMGECGAEPIWGLPAHGRGEAWPGLPTQLPTELQPAPRWPVLISLPGARGRLSRWALTWEDPVPTVYPGMVQTPSYQPAMMPAPMPMMPAMGPVPGKNGLWQPGPFFGGWGCGGPGLEEGRSHLEGTVGRG